MVNPGMLLRRDTLCGVWSMFMLDTRGRRTGRGSPGGKLCEGGSPFI